MDDSSLKIRRSTRDIKRPKFDDEIVQSIPVTSKGLIKKRPDRERSLQSPDFMDTSSVCFFIFKLLPLLTMSTYRKM